MVDRIGELAPHTAESLRMLVHSFEIERIRELLAEFDWLMLSTYSKNSHSSLSPNARHA